MVRWRPELARPNPYPPPPKALTLTLTLTLILTLVQTQAQTRTLNWVVGAVEVVPHPVGMVTCPLQGLPQRLGSGSG